MGSTQLREIASHTSPNETSVPGQTEPEINFAPYVLERTNPGISKKQTAVLPSLLFGSMPESTSRGAEADVALTTDGLQIESGPARKKEQLSWSDGLSCRLTYRDSLPITPSMMLEEIGVSPNAARSFINENNGRFSVDELACAVRNAAMLDSLPSAVRACLTGIGQAISTSDVLNSLCRSTTGDSVASSSESTIASHTARALLTQGITSEWQNILSQLSLPIADQSSWQSLLQRAEQIGEILQLRQTGQHHEADELYTVALQEDQVSDNSEAQENSIKLRRSPIVKAVEKARPSVVSIDVVKETWSGTKDVVGTGIIVDERGYIVTNAHVVGNSKNITVNLQDGSQLYAKVVTKDIANDLAVIKISPKKPLKEIRLGAGTDLMEGETAIAIGAPFGYKNTVTTGIISNSDRTIKMPDGPELKGLIQTSASVNPGNSGGPLLNINGELIGVVCALREDSQGIAFAINSETVQDRLATLLSAKKQSYIDHGIVCTKKVAESGEERQSLVIKSVPSASPLEKGDIILQIGGRKVCNRFDLERAFWSQKPGDTIKIKVMRNGKELELDLKLAKAK